MYIYRISLVLAIFIACYFSEIARVFFTLWGVACIFPGLLVKKLFINGSENGAGNIIFKQFLFPLKAFIFIWNLKS
ncbi:hypothetical protein ASG68_25465 [Rhizobium sp. Leaf453]|nr:hypothetical protein ASG68_25465 [Rhizobium sp. Leaf453]